MWTLLPAAGFLPDIFIASQRLKCPKPYWGGIYHIDLWLPHTFFYCSLNWFLPTVWVWSFSELLGGIRWFIYLRRSKWLWFKLFCFYIHTVQLVLLITFYVTNSAKFSDCTIETGLLPLHVVNLMDVMRTDPLWWDWLQ